MAATRHRLDAERWHFQHGPMDLLLQAEGDAQAVAAAHEAAWRRFEPLLDELVAELPALRQPVQHGEAPLRGAVARCMWQACAAHLPHFITPMAAVAGAVAQALVASYQRPGVTRAWVNNGGDIALHLAPGTQARVGLFADLSRFDPATAQRLSTDGQFSITADMPVRGVATSGWRGRSLSLGIADSVTVLAATAAQADAAATMVANAVNVEHVGITRLPASACQDNSDLAERLVTVGVQPLPEAEVHAALSAGAAYAQSLQQSGQLHAAVLVCQGQWWIVQPLCSALRASRAQPTAVPGGSQDWPAPRAAFGSVFA